MVPPILPLDWSRYTMKAEIVAREADQLRPYPFTSIQIPGLSDEDYALLLDSIRANGVTEPLTVTPEGLVVDGQARLRASRQAGLHAVPTKVLDAQGETDYALWAAAVNLGRRHLTTPQRSALLHAALAILEDRARASQRATQFRPNAEKTLKPSKSVSTRNSEGSTVGANLHRPSEHAGRTREQAARLLDVSPRQAAKMIAVAKHGRPELKEAVAAGKLSVHRAYEKIQSQQPQGSRPLPRAKTPAARPAAQSGPMTDQPVKTLRTVGALIPQWLEELPAWPQERQEQFWRALQSLSDSCEMAFQRRAQVNHPTAQAGGLKE